MALKLLSLTLLTAMCAAQATFNSAIIHIENHGGWGLSVNVGANIGDQILLDVKCDHTISGKCFIEIPRLSTGKLFKAVNCSTCGYAHQRYKIFSPTTGDQFVTAQYGWIGPQVHYRIAIIASEQL